MRPVVSILTDVREHHTGFLNHGEIEILAYLIGSVRPRTVIEFGVNAGRTARAILEAVDGIQRYIGIDVPPEFETALPIQRGEVHPRPGHLAADDPRFELLLPANGSRDLAASDLPQAEAVFVDGDHSRAGVLHDTMLARSVLRPGGICIWHDDHDFDLGMSDVCKVLDELFEARELITARVHGTWLAYERVTESLREHNRAF